MKKFFIAIIILLSSFSLTFAEEKKSEEKDPCKNDEGEVVCIMLDVTQKIPGVSCSPNKKKGYTCLAPKTYNGTLSMLGRIIDWFSFLALITGVLVIAICGVMYSMGGADENLKSEAKKWIVQIIFGIIFLFSAGYILQLIGPWVYK